MRSVQRFPRQLNDFLSRNFDSMRQRISAATLPYTRRNLSRKHNRIPSLNRKGCRRSFVIGMTCAMSRKGYQSQGFLMALLNRGVA
jgi:hypothetical protein